MNLKKISKLLLIPILTTVTLGVSSNLVEAKTKNYEETMKKYFNGVVSRDVDAIVNNSIDSRYENYGEYKEFIAELMENADSDIMITDYKILDDGNPDDEYFKVRNFHEDGTIADLNLKVDTKTNKVLTGSDFEDIGNYIQKTDNGVRVVDNLNTSNKAIAQRWGGELSKNGIRTTGVFSTSGTSVAINYTQNYISGSTQSTSLLYELVKKGTVSNTILNTKTVAGDNTSAKQFYFTRSTTGTRFQDVFVRIKNTYNNKIKIAGEAYI